jgi:hypothetical protein
VNPIQFCRTVVDRDKTSGGRRMDRPGEEKKAEKSKCPPPPPLAVINDGSKGDAGDLTGSMGGAAGRYGPGPG